MLFVPDEAELNILLLNKQGFEGNGITLRAYQTPLVIDQDTVLGDFVECDYSGYAPQPLTFGDPEMAPDARAQMMALPVTFPVPASGFQPCYGFFATDGLEPPTLLFFARKLPSLVMMLVGMEPLEELVIFTLRPES